MPDVADHALGPADALGHGGLGHEVGLRDLAGGEATDGSEGERHRRRRREVGVRAQEVEAQRVVGARDGAGGRCGVEPHLAVAARRVGPRHVEEGPPRDRDEPSGGVGRRLVLPRGERSDERLLHGVLGRREVGSATDEDAQHLWDELAELDLVDGHSVTVGGVGQERPDLEPLVDRLAAGARGGRQLTSELDRSLLAVDVDHEPAGDQVLRLGERPVGHRRAPLAVGADPQAVGRQRLPVDELAAAARAGRRSPA